MCGRARCTLRPEQVSSACGFKTPLQTLNEERFRSSYNISPGSYMPVLRKNHDENCKSTAVHYMKWGLIPSFTKKSEEPDHFRMFNARSESVHEKASFRKLIPRGRCLAVVEGFFEWKKDGSKKQPYYIHFEDTRPLVFAALFDCWTNSTGEELYTFTILTTCSSKALAWLHDRMPVILGDQQAIDNWLDTNQSYETLRSTLRPYDHQDLVWYPVTAAMGKTSFDGPECIKQLKIGGEPKNTIAQLFGKSKEMSSPHTKQAKSEFAEEKIETKALEGAMMNEHELKEFLAGVKPDHEMNLQKNDRGEKMPETESHLVTKPIKHELGVEETKPAKKRKSPERSPMSRTKGASPGARDGQRSLLTFFGRD